MKAMRRRIALQKHFVRNPSQMAAVFRGSFGSADASSRRFAWCGKYVQQHGQSNRHYQICVLAVAICCVTSCATVSLHKFSEPTTGWQTKSGQLMYRSPKTIVIGEALVRFSKTGDFELTVSKGPGITLLSLRQDAAFAKITGAFARQGWSGPTSQAPPQLRGWLALRDQFLHAPNQKILRYTAGDETFVFRF